MEGFYSELADIVAGDDGATLTVGAVTFAFDDLDVCVEVR